MTDVNTYNVLNSEGFKNPNMKVIENNPAAAQERIEKSASQVTNPSNVQIFAPKNDPVSTFVGGYGKDNNIEAIKEVPSMATTGNSVHSSPAVQTPTWWAATSRQAKSLLMLAAT